jgi:hypothetical protein
MLKILGAAALVLTMSAGCGVATAADLQQPYPAGWQRAHVAPAWHHRARAHHARYDRRVIVAPPAVYGYEAGYTMQRPIHVRAPAPVYAAPRVSYVEREVPVMRKVRVVRNVAVTRQVVEHVPVVTEEERVSYVRVREPRVSYSYAAVRSSGCGCENGWNF